MQHGSSGFGHVISCGMRRQSRYKQAVATTYKTRPQSRDNPQGQGQMRRADMRSKFWIALGVIAGLAGLQACAPVVIAGAGAGAVIIADELAEKDGDQGLF